MLPGIYVAGVIVAGSRTNEIFIEKRPLPRQNRSPKISESSCDWDRRQTQAAVSDQCRAPGKSFRTLITDRWLVTFYLAAGRSWRP